MRGDAREVAGLLLRRGQGDESALSVDIEKESAARLRLRGTTL
jgi:hypothetical protein